MNIPKGIIKLDVRRLKLIDQVEMAATSLREKGEEDEAILLFRLRIKIREGLSFEEAKSIFDKHTKNFLGEKS